MVSTRQKKTPFQGEGEDDLPTASRSLFLIHGDDDFLIAEEARRIIASLLPDGVSEYGVEIIEGMASNQGEAAAIFGRLFEALQSRSFFADERVVWWRNTNLLGTSVTASTVAVSDFLSTLNQLLQQRLPTGVFLVITATDLDGRKSVAHTVSKMGKVIAFKRDPYKQEVNLARSLDFAREAAAELGKKLEEGAGHLLVEMAGGDSRTIRSELEKLAVYIGSKTTIQENDLREVGSWRPGGVVWDLTDAMGERNLGKSLATLDDLLFAGEEPVALLFAMISRVRPLLLLSVLMEKKLLHASKDYPSFKAQLERLPAWVSESLPDDKKLNPLANHPFVLYKAAAGAARYSPVELRRALETLLECNERMVSGKGVPKNILEEALLKICMAS